jgi:hypothetical protein
MEHVASFARMSNFFATEVMARQIVNADMALTLAGDDRLDWLIHLDVDELLYADDHICNYLRNAPPCVGQVIYPNYEALPESSDICDYFKEVTLFKKNPCFCSPAAVDKWLDRTGRTWFYVAYCNGKAAVRIATGVSTAGVHIFDISKTRYDTVIARDHIILHYPNCGLERFRLKYRARGNFPDKCFDQWSRLPAHLLSRDVVNRGSRDDVLAFYERHMCSRAQADVEYLLALGIGERIIGPSKWLSAPTTHG